MKKPMIASSNRRFAVMCVSDIAAGGDESENPEQNNPDQLSLALLSGRGRLVVPVYNYGTVSLIGSEFGRNLDLSSDDISLDFIKFLQIIFADLVLGVLEIAKTNTV